MKATAFCSRNKN